MSLNFCAWQRLLLSFCSSTAKSTCHSSHTARTLWFILNTTTSSKAKQSTLHSRGRSVLYCVMMVLPFCSSRNKVLVSFMVGQYYAKKVLHPLPYYSTQPNLRNIPSPLKIMQNIKIFSGVVDTTRNKISGYYFSNYLYISSVKSSVSPLFCETSHEHILREYYAEAPLVLSVVGQSV